MGLRFQKRVKLGKSTSMNVSKSGVSFTQRLNKFVTVNSRGIITFSLPSTGLSYRVNIKKFLKR